jgi:hypothetical protein
MTKEGMTQEDLREYKCMKDYNTARLLNPKNKVCIMQYDNKIHTGSDIEVTEGINGESYLPCEYTDIEICFDHNHKYIVFYKDDEDKKGSSIAKFNLTSRFHIQMSFKHLNVNYVDGKLEIYLDDTDITNSITELKISIGDSQTFTEYSLIGC